MVQTNSMKRTKGTGSLSQRQLQVLSELTSRIALASRLGLSHGGDRDLYKTLGYPQKITSQDLIKRWKRQDMARAMVDRPVKATWRGEVVVSESSEKEETDLEKAYKQLASDLGLKRKFMRVDRLSQLGKYAVMLLGFDDSAPDTWAQPVSVGQRELKYIRVLSETNAEIATWEQDSSNERYGLPRLYTVKFKHPGQAEKEVSLKVHHSRIIHVATDLLEDEVEGCTPMETAYNRLLDLEKLVGGSAEMFWRGARPGYAGNAKEDYNIGEDAKKKMQEQIEEYENDLRRIMVMEGIDLQALQQQLADPKGHVEVQMQMLSALTGIPLRILLGSERGQLASGQDDDNWKEWLHDRRLETAEPVIMRPFVDRMIETGVFPQPKAPSEGYNVSWPDLFTLGEKDKAEVGSKRAQAIANYAKEPAAEAMVPLEAFLRYVLRMDDQEVNHIIELHEAHMKEIIEEEDELEDSMLEDAPEDESTEN